MKRSLLSALAAAALACPARALPAAEADIFKSEQAAPEAEIAGAVTKVFRPAYRVAEGVSDGVYDLLRAHLSGAVLPGRLSRDMAKTPGRESTPAFESILQSKETRYIERLRESYPAHAAGAAQDPGRVEQWRAWALEEQAGVALDSVKDALIDRYGLNPFSRRAGAYARDRRNWDAATLTRAGLIAGTFIYLNGLHATGHAGALAVAVDLRPGLRLRQALQSDGDAARVAGLELGLKGKPLTLAAEWGVRSGALRRETVGLKYRLRY